MTDFTWPKPWLQGLYEQAIEDGCIRIVIRAPLGSVEAEEEWKSFKAAFYRMRRKRDAANAMQDPRYQYVSLRHEPHIGRVLIIYSALPDDQVLPTIEAVDGKTALPQPVGSLPKITPELEPEDFDATAHVRGLLNKIEIEDENEDGGGAESIG
jgi:hypothetical protein